MAHISPLQMQAWPQILDDAEYLALASLFATAAEAATWPRMRRLTTARRGRPRPEPAAWRTPPETGPRPEEQDPPAWMTRALACRRTCPAPARTRPASRTGRARPTARPRKPGLRIGVLGTLTINGTPGALLPAQSQLVLALALNGRDGLSNPQLCYLLGADPDHPKPTDSLRQLIVRTRRQLGRAPDGREWIEHLGAGQYALHPQTRFDWHEFDALARAGMQARDAGRLREATAADPRSAVYRLLSLVA